MPKHIRGRVTLKWRICARPFGVGPKSPLTALKMLERDQTFLALFALSETILDPTQLRVLNLNRP